MSSIFEITTREVTDTPILLFDCTLSSGAMQRWSTHAVTVEGHLYAGRVLLHNMFDIRAASEDGLDAISKVSITLANADSYFSEIERATGFKGSKVVVRFVFADLPTGIAASDDAAIMLQGVCNAPDEITESTFRLTIVNRLSLQRTLLPQVRIQRRCPWVFPATVAQRTEAIDGLTRGKYSSFFRCGYSPDISGGAGTLNGTVPFETCDFSRSQCTERGMFSTDAGNRVTRRFGGIEFVPSSILVKTFGDKSQHVSGTVENEARYNDFVPMVYGIAWYRPPIIFARNDGNLTHLEVLLGMGEINNILTVIANGIEIPAGQAGRNMTATGWFNLVSFGNRTGNFNTDFQSGGQALGDPYGSMAVLSIVLPNRISDGATLPRVEVLLEGMKLSTFDATGGYVSEAFTQNPAWILLDILRRSGWLIEEVDVVSFARTAAYCDELIETRDLYGNPKQIPRFRCNLAITKRRTAADLIRGVRTGSALYLGYGTGGALQLRPESAISVQQPAKAIGTNATQALNGGWPAYEFGDGTSGFSDILRRSNREPSIRVRCRSNAETPNRYSVEFQDEFNEYQQDSLSMVDFADVDSMGNEVSAALTTLGLPNFSQAARVIQLQLNRSIRGNIYVDFEAGMRGLGLKPGDLITITYLKEGFNRQLFRITRIAPSMNYCSSVITAQIHSDDWYVGSPGGGLGLLGGGRQPSYEIGLPRPLLGDQIDSNGHSEFSVQEVSDQTTDGSYTVSVAVGFSAPQKPSATGPGVPLVSLATEVAVTGGSISGNQTLYYAISGVDAAGNESELSFTVRAAVTDAADANTVTVNGLSFSAGTAAFHVYRGPTPSQLFRIAANQPIASAYTDMGGQLTLASAPDRNFDHANFYWRLELQPEAIASSYSTNTIGSAVLQMLPNEFRGKLVLITLGHGQGQERMILSSTASTLTVSTNWEIIPDATSRFVVSENGWQFGTLVSSSPASFEVPNRRYATVQISGRAANVHDRESSYELSPLTRHQIGGAAGQQTDQDVPGAPTISLFANGQGLLEVHNVAFADLANTSAITAGTLSLFYLDETLPVIPVSLAQPLDELSTELHLSMPAAASPGDLVQVDREVMQVTSILDAGLRYVIRRAAYESSAASHSAGTLLYHLLEKVFILPFVPGFFGTPASGSYSYPIAISNARIAAAGFFVTNTRGKGPETQAGFTGNLQSGIRTLSGGQFSMQVEGYLAIQTNAVPALPIDATHSVRDVFATVIEAPTITPIELRVTVDSIVYCSLTIAVGQTRSAALDGFFLGPLRSGSQLGLDIISVGQTNDSTPGRDLTVTVRI